MLGFRHNQHYKLVQSPYHGVSLSHLSVIISHPQSNTSQILYPVHGVFINPEGG